MTETVVKRRLRAGDSERLCSLLNEEQQQYAGLLGLAREQNGALRLRDLEGLEKNSELWNECLTPAVQARRRREAFTAALAGKLGVSAEAIAPKYLVDYVDEKTRGIIGEAVQRLIETAAALDRQNELNGRLAAFCSDLAREETEIFKHTVLADPAGCYDEDARKATTGQSGFFIRQA